MSLNRRIFSLSVVASVGLACMTVQAAETRPNVILIYTGDHGYTDLGVHGIDKHVDIPHMDARARGGAQLPARGGRGAAFDGGFGR